MHRLLERQLRRFGGTETSPPADWAGFLAAVQSAYEAADSDRHLLERSMELVSQELLDANQRLEAEQIRLRSTFLEAPAAIAMFSGPTHVITLANRVWQEVTGRTDAVGRPFREVFPELEGTGLFERLDQVYRSGEPFTAREMRILLDRGRTGTLEETYWDFVWQPLLGREGSVADVLVHAVEVTHQVAARRDMERKAVELAKLSAELERSNRELDQFAYVTSHDLRAPLRGIANLVTWIEEDLGDQAAPELREHLHLLHSRVRRLDSLVTGILEYSRAGREETSPETVDLRGLVLEVVDLLQPPAEVQVEVGQLPTLLTPRLPLQQIFQNLIGNAVKYAASPGAHIGVSARDIGSAWEFSVSDDGPGIEPELQETVFGLFQRLSGAPDVEGAGIGLALVKKLVEAHGGRICLDSAPGAGCTFRFTWPKQPVSRPATHPATALRA